MRNIADINGKATVNAGAETLEVIQASFAKRYTRAEAIELRDAINVFLLDTASSDNWLSELASIREQKIQEQLRTERNPEFSNYAEKLSAWRKQVGLPSTGNNDVPRFAGMLGIPATKENTFKLLLGNISFAKRAERSNSARRLGASQDKQADRRQAKNASTVKRTPTSHTSVSGGSGGTKDRCGAY